MLYTIGIIIILSLLFWHIAVYGDNNIYNILASLPFPSLTGGKGIIIILYLLFWHIAVYGDNNNMLH